MIPLFTMLASIVDVGYWLYYMKQPAYWVRESVGVMIVLLLLLTDRGSKGWIVSLLALAMYPLIGWYASLTLIMLILRQSLRRDWKLTILSTLLLLIGPAMIAGCYTTLRLEDAWFAQLPHAAYSTYSAGSLIWPFVILILSFFLLVLLSHYQPKKGGWLQACAGICAAVCLPFVVNKNDANFHAENRMYRAVKEFRWNQVLEEMKHTETGPTRQMVCCKNLALLHTGRMMEMFDYENVGPAPVVTDSLPLRMAQTIAPILYLYHGMANDATHWTIENGVEYGLTLGDLQVLSLSAIINGESKLAAKYLNMLSLAPFQSGFVKRYYPLTEHPDWLSDYPELKLIAELHSELVQTPFADDGLCEWRIYRTFARSYGYRSPRVRELALIYAMMLKDYSYFWPQLFEYARHIKAKEMPPLIQEATYLGCLKNPKEYPVESFRFDETVLNRYKYFKNRRKPANDHSYWWFYYYCTDAQTY